MGKRCIKAAAIMVALLIVPLAITMIFSGMPKSMKQEAKETLHNHGSKRTSYSMDEYIMMAMIANMDLSMNMETLKAQAVIVRTTIYEKLEELSEKTLTLEKIGLETMTLDQLKRQVSIEEYKTAVSNLENAIYGTRGEILTYQGKPIKALFHYANIGKTRSYKEAYGKELPYLESVDSEKDVQAEVGITTKEYKKAELLGKLKKKYTITEVTEDNLIDALEIKEKEKTGYVHTVKVGKVEITGEAFAEIFSLNSTNFYLEEKEGGVRIVCRGKGSGLGFSQYGANQMAESGASYEELLRYYYRGTTVCHIE